MKPRICFFVLLCLVLAEHTSFSQTVLSGTYDSSYDLTRANSPYLVEDSAVFNSYLYIERGVIVTFKFHPNPEKKPYIRIRRDIFMEIFDGGPPPPVIFTSERDNDPYDLNGDGTASRPAPGDWGYIYFDPESTTSEVYRLDNAIIRYGGGRPFAGEADPGLYPMTIVSDYESKGEFPLTYELDNLTIERSSGVGLMTGLARVTRCQIRNNNYGTRMRTSSAHFENNEICNNRIYPVYIKNLRTKRNGNEDFNLVIEGFNGNQVYDNGVDAIAIEGALGCEFDEIPPYGTIQVHLLAPDPPLPYLVSNDLVIDSVQLVIGKGNLVKFLPEAYTGKVLNIKMQNEASLSVLGTKENKVVFTSMHDHQYDFSVPGNTDAKPVPGDWGIIDGSVDRIENAVFKYGGKYVSRSDERVIPDSSYVLRLSNSASYEESRVDSCLFHQLYANGIFIDNPAMSRIISCSGNAFLVGQNMYGINMPMRSEPWPIPVSAHVNYWNGKLGPFHPELNMNGNGCIVGDNIAFLDFQTFIADSLYLVSSVIRGKVTNQDGDPLEGTLVRLNSKRPRTAYTDRNGQFYISNVRPGTGYRIELMSKAHRDTVLSPLDIPRDTAMHFLFALEAYTIDYAIDSLHFDINPEVSSVSVGGWAHRFYKIIDIKTGKPVYGAEVLVTDLDTFYTNSAGIVDIAIPSNAVGNAFSTKSFAIQRVGMETLDFPLDERETFEVDVLPYGYNKMWSGSTFFKLGIFGFEATKERGAALDLYVKNNGAGDYADSIRMVRQSRTGFGLNLGASAKVEAGPVSAGAEAGVGINLDAIFEDDFKFDYPNTSGRLATAKFIVLADGALPYMDAPLVRFFVSCLERQVSEIEAAALSNGIGMNLHAQASAEAGMDLNLLEADQGSIGAELKGSASAAGDITFMTKVHAHKHPVSNLYPMEIDFSYTGEVELGVNASIGIDLDKLFGDKDDEAKSDDDDDDNKIELDKVDSNLPFPVPDEDFGFDLASVGASGGIKYGIHFGTTRFVPNSWCRMGFMYGYNYNLSASALLLGEAGISENREISYTFDFYDDQTVDMIRQTANLAKTMLSPDKLIDLNISELASGKVFNDPLNEIAYQQTRNSFSIAPVPYSKTISDQVDEGGFSIGIDVGFAVVKAKFGAGFKYAEYNNYTKENGVFYNWNLYPFESYDFLPDNEAFKAAPILQDIVSKSASYLVNEVRQKLIPPIFRKIRIWPFNKKGSYQFSIGPPSRSSHIHFADTSEIITIKGIDSLDVVYWDWYGTGDSEESSKKACDPELKAVCEYVKSAATSVHKLDYGVGGFYQFEPYNTSVGDHEVYVVINYFDDELEVMLSDSSLYTIPEGDLRMYKEDKDNNRWVFIGGIVDTATNTVKARIDAFGTFTLAPFIPTGDIVLTATPDTILLDTTSTCSILSEPVFYNTEVMVADGELFSLRPSRGAFVGDDADPGREGFQVAASGGVIKGIYEANALSGNVTILAESLAGEALGRLEIFIAETEPPTPPELEGVEMNEERVHLWWKGSPEKDVVRYLVHYDSISGGPYNGTATVFGDPSPVDAGLDTLDNLPGLREGVPYYFAISAVDRCGNVSALSNELSITPVFNHRPVFFREIIHIDPDLAHGTVIDTLQAYDQDEGQTLRFYLPEGETEDAFALDPATGILSVNNEARLNYFVTRTDTFVMNVGVKDDGAIPYSDEGPIMVVLDVETWIPEYGADDLFQLGLYPNPAKDVVTMKLGNSVMIDEIRIDIYDMAGRLCLSKEFRRQGEFELRVPVEILEQGIYQVVLNSGKIIRKGKLIIVR